MNDTPEAVQNCYRTLFMRRSGSERVKMGCAMFDTARALARASLRGRAHNDGELRVHCAHVWWGFRCGETVERMSKWLSTPHRAMQKGSAG